MKIAFIVYDGMTSLDFIGVFDPLTRLKTMGFLNDLEWSVCAATSEVTSFEGLRIMPDTVGGELSEYDCIILPGGNGIMALVRDSVFMDWIKSASSTATLATVCGGSLILGFAGMLAGRNATTHPSLYGILEKLGTNVSTSRIVDDGSLITARGVTSAIDLGLYLCEKIAGREVRERIQAQMDYPNYTAE